MKFALGLSLLLASVVAQADDTLDTDWPVGTDATAEQLVDADDSTIAILDRGSYANWGRGRDGWGHCYEYTNSGRVLHGGRPIDNSYCESRRPSYFSWGRGRDRNTYCYQYTPNGYALNNGRPVSNSYCR